MVRNEAQPGRRPGVYEGTLAEIVTEQQRPKDEYASVELKYFDPVTGQKSYVHLGRTHNVKLCVLDLCAFRADSTASLGLNDECPESVIPSWQRYFAELQHDAKNLLQRYQDLKKTPGRENALIAPLTRPNFRGIVSGDLNSTAQTVQYNIKRVRRLLQPRAGELLSRFAIYKTRYAFEHEFGTEPETTPATVTTAVAAPSQPEGTFPARAPMESSGITNPEEAK